MKRPTCNCEDKYLTSPPPLALSDAAMALARRGADHHEIVHTMLRWCYEASEKAAAWAEREDRAIAEDIEKDRGDGSRDE